MSSYAALDELTALHISLITHRLLPSYLFHYNTVVAIAVVSSTNAALEETKVADVPVFLEKKPTLRIKGASPPLTVQMQRSVAAKKKDPTTKNTKKKATTKKATRNIIWFELERRFECGSGLSISLTPDY